MISHVSCKQTLIFNPVAYTKKKQKKRFYSSKKEKQKTKKKFI
jgi:hypothetical protein